MDMNQPAIDKTRFRETCGHYATGVAVVTTSNGDGTAFGVTVNSFTSVSLDPPLVQFSLDRKASVFSTFEQSNPFVINVLARDQEEVSRRFSGKSDDFDGLDCEFWQSHCPVIQGCVASLGCEPYAAYDGGDHLIILGRVAYLDCQSEANPLLFYRGSYGSFS